MKKYSFFFSALLLLFTACQSDSTSATNENTPGETTTAAQYDCRVTLDQFKQIDQLVSLMQSVDAWGDDDALDSIAFLNDSIEVKLRALLDCAATEVLAINPESFDHLYYTQSSDGLIRNFYWYANNGGTWQEMRGIYQYFPKDLTAKVSRTRSFAGATRFYKLQSKEPMFLGFGADKMCSTCILEYAQVFSFKNDTLHIDDIAMLESRMGDILKFEFDPTSQTLEYIVAIDDLNQDWASDKPKQKLSSLNIAAEDLPEGWEPMDAEDVVVQSFVFDGQQFKEK